MCVETNGIEPSTSCLQSTLTIVRSVVLTVGECSLVTTRSSCFRCSAWAQTSGLRSFLCARIDRYSLVEDGHGEADGYIFGYVELRPLTSVPAGTRSFVRRMSTATSHRILMTHDGGWAGSLSVGSRVS